MMVFEGCANWWPVHFFICEEQRRYLLRVGIVSFNCLLHCDWPELTVLLFLKSTFVWLFVHAHEKQISFLFVDFPIPARQDHLLVSYVRKSVL